MKTLEGILVMSLFAASLSIVGCKKTPEMQERPRESDAAFKAGSKSRTMAFESDLTQIILDGSGKIASVLDDKFTVIANGVDETEINCKDSIGDTIRLFITRINLNTPGLSLRTATPYDRDISLDPVTGKNHVQNIKVMGKHIEYKTQKVLAGINGDFYDVSNNILRGPLHRNGTVIKSTFNYDPALSQQALTFVGVRTNGNVFMSEKVDYLSNQADLTEASGGGVMLIKNGVVVNNSALYQQPGEPRTAMGHTTSNIVYMIVVDGRQRGYSWGARYSMLSGVFDALEVQNAVNLDGGGSSTKMIRMPDADTLKIINNPSGPPAGTVRNVASGWVVVSNYQVSTLAGAVSSGFINGTGTTARFHNPSGVAVDLSGNILVTDRTNHSIRKITPAGVVTTFAGTGVSGYANGTPGQFNVPWGSAIDASGNLIVVEKDGARIRKVTPLGSVSSFAGTGVSGFLDGSGAKFNNALDAAVDSYGNIFVVDRNNKRIRKITTAGVVSTFVGDGTATILVNPLAIAIDASNNLYVSDANSIKRITPAKVISTIIGTGTSGFSDGTIGQPLTAQIGDVFGMGFDANGRLFFADATNHRIRKVTPSTTGSWTGAIVTTIAGTGTAGLLNGLAGSARFNNPYDVVLSNSGRIYVADNFNNSIREITYPQ